MKKKPIREDLERFNKLFEYSFNEVDPIKKDQENLLLGGNLTEDEDDEENLEDLGIDSEEFDAGMDGADVDAEVDVDADIDLDIDADTNDDEVEIELDDVSEPEVSADGEEIEVDVTDIMKSSEEAKHAANMTTDKMEQLMAQFSELEDRMSSMDHITGEIESLKQEIEKRNPTPIEKMELRSLNSFPYNVTLGDFWSDKEGYEVSNGDEAPEEEYTIDQEEIDNTYDANATRSGFGKIEDEEDEEQ